MRKKMTCAKAVLPMAETLPALQLFWEHLKDPEALRRREEALRAREARLRRKRNACGRHSRHNDVVPLQGACIFCPRAQSNRMRHMPRGNTAIMH